MQGISGVISVGEDEWLAALALSPPVDEQGRVPVDLVEDVRGVLVACRAVRFAGRSTGTAGPGHVVLVVVEASGGVVAGWEMDVSTERRCIAIAIHVREAGTGALIVGVLHPDTMHAV